MSHIDCNPEVDAHCDYEDRGTMGSDNYGTATTLWGIMSFLNLASVVALAQATADGQNWYNGGKKRIVIDSDDSDDDDDDRLLRESPRVSHNRRRDYENNPADTAWNLMVIWHTLVFYPTFGMWLVQIWAPNFGPFKWFFGYFVALSMAGVYGIYEIIFFTLLFSIASSDDTVDKDYWLCGGYGIISIITGVFQYLWYPDVVNDYYNRFREWEEYDDEYYNEEVPAETIIENEEEEPSLFDDLEVPAEESEPVDDADAPLI